MQNKRIIFKLLLFGFSVLILNNCSEQKVQNIPDLITLRTMGLAYLEENKLPEAEIAFRQLIQLAPDEALGYANLGLVYIRLGNYDRAETELKNALERAPIDPEIQLNLAEVLLLTNREAEAVEYLEETIRHHPNHIRTLYKLGQIYAKSSDSKLSERGEEFLIKVVEFLPANITSRFDLIDLLLRHDKPEMALSYFELLKSQMPEFPPQADNYFYQCIEKMREGEAQKSMPSFNIFRNILKPTALYRSGFDELKGMGGPLIGTPVLSFRQNFNVSNISPASVLTSMQFTDVSDKAGLSVLPVLNDSSSRSDKSYYILSLADFDGNSTQDLYASGFDKKQNKNFRFLLKNDFGKYSDSTSKS